MDIRKIILYFILALLIVVLFNTWQQDYSLKQTKNLNQLTKQCNISDRSAMYALPTLIPRMDKKTKKTKIITLTNKVKKKD